MKKIRLDPAALSVDSFTVPTTVSGRGTIRGRSNTFAGDSCDPQIGTCGPQTCGPAYCALDTFNPDCSGGTSGSIAGDSCDECLTVWTVSPQDCPCH